MDKLNHELRKLLETLERELTHHPLKATALGKIGSYLHGLEKPKRETLDRLSLLAGFQDWDQFRHAIYGDEEQESQGDEEQESQGDEEQESQGDEEQDIRHHEPTTTGD